MRTAVIGVVAAMLLACGSGGPSPQHGPTNDAFVRAFLETWLVQRDLAAARGYLADDFIIHPSMRDRFASGDDVLRHGYECERAPRSCRRLGDCTSGIDTRDGDFDFATRTVDAAMVKAVPELRSREGREVISVDFKLRGCNLGTFILIDKDAPHTRRVLTIVYLAG